MLGRGSHRQVATNVKRVARIPGGSVGLGRLAPDFHAFARRLDFERRQGRRTRLKSSMIANERVGKKDGHRAPLRNALEAEPQPVRICLPKAGYGS